jgi:hypothetical protein
VEKNVHATVVGFDETKSPLLVEQLNFARRHESLLGFENGRGDLEPNLPCLQPRSRPQG